MQIFLWIGFLLLICLFLAVDLGVFNKKAHAITAKEALGWTAVWFTLALIFGGFVYYLYETNWMEMLSADNPLLYKGDEALLNFYTGFLIEKSLSLDNIFVMAVIFSFFRIPVKYQHEILFWGILGAMFFRGVMIYAGVTLISNFTWINYVFGLLLFYSAVQMALAKDNDEVDLLKNPIVRFVTRFYRISDTLDGRFFVMENGKKAVTILFLALIIIETTDILFAVDSIPAIFAITADPFIVFTSNIFAILGLRSLYFVLADFMDRFKCLKYSLIFILAFVGVKIILAHHYAIPGLISLAVIASMLAAGIIVSVIAGKKEEEVQDKPENEQKEPSPVKEEAGRDLVV